MSGLTLILQNLLAVSGEPVSVWSWLLGVGSLVGVRGTGAGVGRVAVPPRRRSCSVRRKDECGPRRCCRRDVDCGSAMTGVPNLELEPWN